MKTILLTKGQVTFVDDADFEWLSQFNWCAWLSPKSSKFYAVRRGHKADGESTTVLMHRQILGLRRGDSRYGDHRDLNTLNNTRDNLRIATPSQSARNQGMRNTNTSGFKGVTRWGKNGHLWMAEITIKGRRIRLGTRPTAERAHFELYVPAAMELHGEFAR